MTQEEAAATFTASIAHVTPLIDRVVDWPQLRLRARTYIGDTAWPDIVASSARAIVFRRGAVVVVRTKDGQRHINPGGQREPGETIEQTVRREVLEECGWAVSDLTPLGFYHFQPLSERPDGFPYRWCDFIHPIFVTEGLAFHRGARDLTQIEAGSSLVPIGRALRALPDWETALLHEAVAVRGSK
jgi:8-oxo-dGTP pyrophosphatase MutT (NUDIX family)